MGYADKAYIGLTEPSVRELRLTKYFDLPRVRSIRLLSTTQHTYVELGGSGIEIAETEGAPS